MGLPIKKIKEYLNKLKWKKVKKWENI
jgi:hypothetical protein